MKELKFNEEMQRAKDEGRKNETRRVVELHADTYGGIEILGGTLITFDANGNELLHECPYGKVGDTNNGCLITDIRVEKLWDISEEDAIKEGIDILPNGVYRNYADSKTCFYTAHESFMSLWESIYPNHPTKGWTLNPYVWVITFESIEL